MSSRREGSRVLRCHQHRSRPRRPDGSTLVSADEDSDSAVGSGDADPAAVADGFRVRVSLERFFTDERARVLIWAERARSAGWLLRRLRASLPLPDTASLSLVVGDWLLPPAEPLAVLRPDDLLQVIISSSEKVPAVEETEATRGVCVRPSSCEEKSANGAGDTGDELEAVKRRALSILDEVEASGELAAAPRRRRRVRRRRAAPPAAAGDDDVDGAGLPTPAQWRAEADAGAVARRGRRRRRRGAQRDAGAVARRGRRRRRRGAQRDASTRRSARLRRSLIMRFHLSSMFLV